jgi:hypothetical protein
VYLACVVPALVIGKQFIERTPELIGRLGDQSTMYAEALRREESMVILNPGLPADDTYWSHALNSIRDAKARHLGTQGYRPVLMVSDPRSPILYGAAAKPFGVYRLQERGCRCLVAYQPPGSGPDLSTSAFDASGVHLLYRPDPAAWSANNPTSLGRSREDSRNVPTGRPGMLAVEGAIDLAVELPVLSVVLPFDETPRVSIRRTDGGAAQESGSPSLPFHLELEFGDAALARRAKEAMCIVVPGVSDRPSVLLRGQPGYCDVFIDRTRQAVGRP